MTTQKRRSGLSGVKGIAKKGAQQSEHVSGYLDRGEQPTGDFSRDTRRRMFRKNMHNPYAEELGVLSTNWPHSILKDLRQYAVIGPMERKLSRVLYDGFATLKRIERYMPYDPKQRDDEELADDAMQALAEKEGWEKVPSEKE
jgi:hypothetical protein